MIKLYDKCVGCKKKKFFVRTRKVMLPIGTEAESHDLMCTTCFNVLLETLKAQNEEKRPQE